MEDLDHKVVSLTGGYEHQLQRKKKMNRSYSPESSYSQHQQCISDYGSSCKSMECRESNEGDPKEQYFVHDYAGKFMNKQNEGTIRRSEYRHSNYNARNNKQVNVTNLSPSSVMDWLTLDPKSTFVNTSSRQPASGNNFHSLNKISLSKHKNHGDKRCERADRSVTSCQSFTTRQQRPVNTHSEIEADINRKVRRQKKIEQHRNVTDREGQTSDLDSVFDDHNLFHHRYGNCLVPSDNMSIMTSFTVDEILVDLTDHEDALSGKGSSIRGRRRKKKVSRLRSGIPRNVSDPILTQISNDDANGGRVISHCRNGRFKLTSPDVASDCSSVTDFTEDHVMLFNTFTKNLPEPSIGSEHGNEGTAHGKKRLKNHRLNNIEDKGQYTFTPKNASRSLSRNQIVKSINSTIVKDIPIATITDKAIALPLASHAQSQSQLHSQEVVSRHDKNKDLFNQTVLTMSSSGKDFCSSITDVIPSVNSSSTTRFVINSTKQKDHHASVDQHPKSKTAGVKERHYKPQLQRVNSFTAELHEDEFPTSSHSVAPLMLGQISGDETDTSCDNDCSPQTRRMSKVVGRGVVNVGGEGGTSKVFQKLFRRKSPKALISKSFPSSTDPSAEAAEMRRRLALSNGSGNTGPMYKNKDKKKGSKGARSALSFIVPTNACSFPPAMVITTKRRTGM